MFAKTINHAKFLLQVSRVLRLVKGIDGGSQILVPDEIETSVDKNLEKICLIFEGQSISYQEFERRANRIANWALGQNLKPGDSVALVMENNPDYPATWFGLSKVGIATALINHQLEGQGLAHCINSVDAKAVISAGIQAEHVSNCADLLDCEPENWDFDGTNGHNLNVALKECSEARPDRKWREKFCGKDTFAYIFTSGTTGLPKAAKLVHERMRRVFRIPVILCNMSSEDIVYNVLPLYHITGGGLAMGGALFTGATTFLKRKFSASDFWQDVYDKEATLFVYIGELCRYLINNPVHLLETSHKLRAGFGNGIRADVWEDFVDRFTIPTMRELYGSTEGNVSFFNLDGKIGAVGQAPAFLDKKIGTAFVKFDVEAEMPVRTEDGFCIKCNPNEVGEVIGRISTTGRESFQGYHDENATQKKILRNVFESGDAWFRTGDLMRRDDLGYIYFVDRIGDTFRWKGENVATNEVSDILSKFDGVDMANVYGVQIPGAEGRAGMASITLAQEIDFSILLSHLMNNLPSYAVPLFLRIQQDADTTGTFKFRKFEAVREGFDIDRIKDPICFLNPESHSYERLNRVKYQRILNNKFRF